MEPRPSQAIRSEYEIYSSGSADPEASGVTDFAEKRPGFGQTSSFSLFSTGSGGSATALAAAGAGHPASRPYPAVALRPAGSRSTFSALSSEPLPVPAGPAFTSSSSGSGGGGGIGLSVRARGRRAAGGAGAGSGEPKSPYTPRTIGRSAVPLAALPGTALGRLQELGVETDSLFTADTNVIPFSHSHAASRHARSVPAQLCPSQLSPTLPPLVSALHSSLNISLTRFHFPLFLSVKSRQLTVGSAAHRRGRRLLLLLPRLFLRLVRPGCACRVRGLPRPPRRAQGDAGYAAARAGSGRPAGERARRAG